MIVAYSSGKSKRLKIRISWESFMEMRFPLFQQDFAPSHCAKTAKTWFTDQGLTVLERWANWPDLNSIETLQGFVRKQIRNTRHNSADELKAAIKAAWASITPLQHHKLIPFIPRHTDGLTSGSLKNYSVHKWTYFSKHFC